MPSSSRSCKIYNILPEYLDVPKETFSDFERFIEELESDPITAVELSTGRKWVADNFYSDQKTLASIRLSSGLSQKQLGIACGIAQSHVSRYESGKHEPSLSLAASMAKTLGVTLDEFSEAWNNTRNSLSSGEHK